MVASEPIRPAARIPAGFSGFAAVSVLLRQGYLCRLSQVYCHNPLPETGVSWSVFLSLVDFRRSG